MIRYQTTEAELNARIDACNATWRTRAAQRTDDFRAKGKYAEASGIWSDIKAVYMELQHDKCAYCERKLEDRKIEHDVEHFRPKSTVADWPPAQWPPKSFGLEGKLNYAFGTGPGSPMGYYLLAYHPLNYATACKVCNSDCKSDYFPVYGPRDTMGDHPVPLAGEQPLLIYPIGEIDTDPEDLITFNGVVPIPTKAAGYDSYRAQVTIDLFLLEKREHLREGRALRIRALWLTLFVRDNAATDEDRDAYQKRVERMLSPRSEHCNCLRAFHRLYINDPDVAREVYEAVEDYLESRGL